MRSSRVNAAFCRCSPIEVASRPSYSIRELLDGLFSIRISIRTRSPFRRSRVRSVTTSPHRASHHRSVRRRPPMPAGDRRRRSPSSISHVHPPRSASPAGCRAARSELIRSGLGPRRRRQRGYHESPARGERRNDLLTDRSEPEFAAPGEPPESRDDVERRQVLHPEDPNSMAETRRERFRGRVQQGVRGPGASSDPGTGMRMPAGGEDRRGSCPLHDMP